MKNSACSAATRHTTDRERRTVIAEILVQQLAVQAADVVDESIEAVACENREASRVAHPPSEGAIGEQRRHAFGERGGGAERREEADAIAVDDVANAADLGADARDAGGEALNQRDR